MEVRPLHVELLASLIQNPDMVVTKGPEEISVYDPTCAIMVKIYPGSILNGATLQFEEYTYLRSLI